MITLWPIVFKMNMWPVNPNADDKYSLKEIHTDIRIIIDFLISCHGTYIEAVSGGQKVVRDERYRE